MFDFVNSLNIVLHEPEIPGNTGTIGRLCVGLEATLTLIEPLGFSLADKYLKRAGLDYWPHLKLQVLPDLQHFFNLVEESGGQVFAFTTKTRHPYCHAQFKRGDFLLFGKETKGLPADILQRYSSTLCTLPMTGPIRSLNLSMAVGVAAYEAMRQISGGFQ